MIGRLPPLAIAFSGVFVSSVLPGCTAEHALPQAGIMSTFADSVPYVRSGKQTWMDQNAKNGDLLYVSRQSAGEIQVYTYPKGKPAGILTGFDSPQGLCTDKNGDLFVVTSQQILVYAHGGTTPIKTLDDTGNAPHGCAVDPTTGNLAVSGGLYQNTEANIAIYNDASGSPTVYKDGFVSQFVYCTYDDAGNVFTNGGPMTELPSGSSSFVGITVNQPFNQGYPALQWDGDYIAIQNPSVSKHGPTTILQVSVSGTTGTVVKTISLSSPKNKNNYLEAQFWVQVETIVNPEAQNGNVGLWHYPTGGKPYGTVKVQPSMGTLRGLAVSLARRPKH